MARSRPVYRRRHAVLLTLAALALCGAAGCAGPVNTIRRGEADVPEDLMLRDTLSVLSFRVTRTAMGRPKALLKLQNLTGHGITIDYRFVWFDKGGAEIHSPFGDWQMGNIGPNEIQTFWDVPDSPLATERVEFRFRRSA